ncbi:MAG: phenylacetic acid degradation protein [Candidatus Rokuibacteriota bacterium]|nr:MAG: phenylacetic acid degradation protein [Candidatus Rokubacteria bacterium]PYN54232.1 MAG: phenylacetic acid degradation protein [Candidatus Rokubacteria bacterium]
MTAMALAATKAELQRILDDVGFTRAYGFRLHSIADGRCTLEVPFQALFERPGGIVSGQVFMAAADVAMWLAIMTRLGARDGSVTAGMTSAFLGPARREPFRCTARVVKLGGRLVYGVAESFSRSGRLLTHHSLTYARPSR